MIKEEADALRVQQLKQQKTDDDEAKAVELANQRDLAEARHKLLMLQRDAQAMAEIEKTKIDGASVNADLRLQLASLRQRLVAQSAPAVAAPLPDNNRAFQSNIEEQLARQSEAMQHRMESFTETSNNNMMALFDKRQRHMFTFLNRQCADSRAPKGAQSDER